MGATRPRSNRKEIVVTLPLEHLRLEISLPKRLSDRWLGTCDTPEGPQRLRYQQAVTRPREKVDLIGLTIDKFGYEGAFANACFTSKQHHFATRRVEIGKYIVERYKFMVSPKKHNTHPA